MSAVIFNGREQSKFIENLLLEELHKVKNKGEIVSIFNSSHASSLLYTSLKGKAVRRLDVPFQKIPLGNSTELETLRRLLSKLNADPGIVGIMIQLPIFDNDPQKELDAVSLISPTKDVDCLTPTNLGLIQAGRPWILPATVRAVLEVLAAAGGLSMVDRKSDQLDIFDQYKLRLSWIIGKKVAVVGSRGMVGAPLISVLSYLGATVTGCHRQTWDLEEELKKADIVISAAGSPRIVKKEMIKEGAVVIDVGTSIIDGKVIGDVNHEVAEVASFITPVPGGVGPMTVAMLLCNFIDLSGSLVGSRPRSGSRICH